MKCNSCGRARNWVGYKTGLGKTPEQLQEMRKEETTCKFCGSKNVECDLDRESETGQDFGEMDNFAASIILSIIGQRKK
ncbi:MAG: hypothetical protein A2534_00675 [Candidatus Magasanikbacteria bacterium RIFOXYD2_FULL_39_9]|uniref:Uncharacterized protein n=1 Tax=Candidatus Magasanikbacteria bacterium RIFOXYD1_FULL_40_23 TaxID=1798705 RepID=A0A1F6P8S3_9BACT|nr:MAG: hypothetical protein A2563_02770 [Candidatus Magasanikbacteria bacterium RIFOXYD1_FULL_40_23]OGH93143.1 MAG: hypothetical protein A2534_00675 [Candidatus Magasanikbacteria bacterium RIFOXYD2_FULL_39_9]